MTDIIQEIERRTTDGFTLVNTALVEHESLLDVFGDLDSIVEEQKGIDSGELVYFCARVEALRNDIVLGTDYLGCCCYKTFEDFANGEDYHADMMKCAMDEARTALKELCS